MISVPADIAGQPKHAAEWLYGRKEQGPSPVLARAKRQMEELEVDWVDAFAVPETESVTVRRPKKKRTEEPAATSHLPSAISASHTAKAPHLPGKVLAQQLLAQAAQRVQRQAEQAKKKEDEAKKKKKEEEEKRKKKEKEEEEKRKKKEKEEEERRKKKEKE